MKYQYVWAAVSPQDEKRYDIEMNDGTIVENVEYWAFGGGFKPSEKLLGTANLVEYSLENVAAFSLANAEVKRGAPNSEN